MPFFISSTRVCIRPCFFPMVGCPEPGKIFSRFRAKRLIRTVRASLILLATTAVVGWGMFVVAAERDAEKDSVHTVETAQDEWVRLDFEDGSPQGFTVAEGAFGKWIGDRESEYHSAVPYTKQEKYYLSTLDNTDATVPDDRFTGVIESPVFMILADPAVGGGDKTLATMLVGGGGKTNPNDIYIALVTFDDHSEVLYARGDDSQKFLRREWDVSPYVGRSVFLRIVDRGTGGWCHILFDDFACPGRFEPELTKTRDAEREQRRIEESLRTKIEPLQTAISVLGDIAASADGTSSIGDAVNSVREQYDAARRLAAAQKLKLLAKQLEAFHSAKVLPASDADLEQLRREVFVTCNPFLATPILYVNRAQYVPDHHNTATMFQTGEINTNSFRGGASLKVWDPRSDETRTIYSLPEGGIRDPEVSFDGTKILFSARKNRDDDYHLYEISATATPENPVGLRQITGGAGVTDIDPIYLPDGNILFASTRDPKYCMCNRHIMCNLFRCHADGTNIVQITWNTLFDGHPCLLDDGRIIYDRWEYVDRNFGSAQGTWTINPDGTRPVVHYGNSTMSPGAVLDARPIPGTQKVVVTFSSCHDRPWGALAILDRQRGVENRPGVERTWPASAIELVDVGDYDTFTRVNPKYEDPYPLSENFFLCSRMIGIGADGVNQGERVAIFLVDTFGNEILIHEDGAGCFDPMPLAPREMPPVIAARCDPASEMGEFFVEDVYRGESMRGVERGEVKSLRIVASPEKRFWCNPGWDGGTGEQAPGMAWDDFNNKAIIGTVPVAEDGSASFTVPTGLFVYFQLLDADGRMIHSMRSGTTVQPGERTGCVGCHENRRSSVPLSAPMEGIVAELSDDPAGMLPMAVRQAPSEPKPWYGPTRNFGYRAEVQPVWDRYCVLCHDYGKPAGEVLNLASDATMIFNTSYVELRRKKDVGVRVVGAGPAQVLAARQWGANLSPVAQVVLHGHRDPANDIVDGKRIVVDPESVDRVMTWIDLNAPYYPEYATGFPNHPFGRAPITDAETRRIAELTGLNPFDSRNFTAFSFTRPECSPALAGVKNAADRAEAIAILQRGRKRFDETPGADMSGFRLTRPEEIRQAEKVLLLRETDNAARRVLRSEMKESE